MEQSEILGWEAFLKRDTVDSKIVHLYNSVEKSSSTCRRKLQKSTPHTHFSVMLAAKSKAYDEVLSKIRAIMPDHVGLDQWKRRRYGKRYVGWDGQPWK